MVWCGVAWCGVRWCGVALCGVVWRGLAWCGVNKRDHNSDEKFWLWWKIFGDGDIGMFVVMVEDLW